MMPFLNEHACRLRQPGDFQPNSFRRIKSGRVWVIVGKLQGATRMTIQTIRYPKDGWSAEDARADCEKQGGSFEAARKTE